MKGLSSKARLGALSLTVAAVAGAATLVAPIGAASAAPAGGGQGPAILGGLLQVFGFGATVGIPTGCQAATAALGSGAAYFNAATQAFPVISALNNGCSTAATQGASLVSQGETADAPLEAVDPFVNPMIGEVATSVTMVGTNYGPALAPFGPTIAGAGGTINFFQGA